MKKISPEKMLILAFIEVILHYLFPFFSTFLPSLIIPNENNITCHLYLIPKGALGTSCQCLGQLLRLSTSSEWAKNGKKCNIFTKFC